MTLCISVLLKEGVVLSADSCATRSIPNYGVDEKHFGYDAIKLYKINKKCGLLTAGDASFYSSGNEIEITDLLNQFKEDTHRIKKMYIHRVVEHFCIFIEKTLKPLLGEEEKTVFIVAGYGKDPNPCMYKISATSLGVSMEIINITPEKAVRDKAIGADGFIEIVINFNARLKGLDELVENQKINLKQSIEYCESAINEVSNYIKNKGVGPPVDIAVITRKRGFRWITNHHRKKLKA